MFSCHVQILDEVERRRGVSAALVYPFMRSLMESPFPAPGKIIKVKTFLPGAGNEVRNAARTETDYLISLHVNYILITRGLEFSGGFFCGLSGHRAEAAQ